MEIIDLRSDTVTQPTPEMRQAMANAAVGDDVYGEDPTVNTLQELAAEMLGKEAGLFVVSGTMGNLVAVLAHCGRGDEAILGKQSHTYLFEAGGISALGGVHSCQLPNQPDGTMNLDDIRSAIRANDAHCPTTRLICLENTHNRCGGAALGVEYTKEVGELAQQNGLRLHLDGARLFNASAATGASARELAAPVDSVTFCLSKGLCAPVGSVLCGSREFIDRAHRIRKQLGGGMRQAGVLAAAGIVSLQQMTGRLAQDHERAMRLAKGLAQIPGVLLDPGTPNTNMVFFSLVQGVFSAQINGSPAEILLGELARRGVRIGAAGANRFRMVTHYWIDDRAVDMAIQAFAETLQPETIL